MRTIIILAAALLLCCEETTASAPAPNTGTRQTTVTRADPTSTGHNATSPGLNGRGGEHKAMLHHK